MDMEQIYIDSLKALMVYKYDLDTVVLELERAEQQNMVLYCALAAVLVAAVLAGIYISKRHRRVLGAERLANRLLSRQAENLPLFAEKVNRISSKSIKLSGPLYDELQDVISMVKANSKAGLVEVVNDLEFRKMYPFLESMDFLTPQEKLVLILTEDDCPISDIALYTGTSEASVRAMKSRIRNKLVQSGSIGGTNKRMKILKKN